MPHKGYNYNFSMFLEGIGDIPFQSANIVCTPNGVEASINMHSNEALMDLKPKTACQLFFTEWIGDKRGNRILCDGFLSRFDKNEDSSGGVGVAIQVRDFRMDIRKAPAALAFKGSGDLSSTTLYPAYGIFNQTTYKVAKSPYTDNIPESSTDHLSDLWDIVSMIANSTTRQGGQANTVNAQWISSYKDYYSGLIQCLPSPAGDKTGRRADGAFFLDAFLRGMWMQAAGGTAISRFLNTRIRANKRFMIPRNEAGYLMFSKENLGQLVGEAAYGDSLFTSIEALLMRAAALFMVRVYSCNTPMLISLEDNVNGKPNPIINYVIDDRVRQFMIKQGKDEFGPPFMLNQSMLLPPLEFTAPPDCNIIFPCMCNRIVWQMDWDAEITRGYFHNIHCLSTGETELELKWSIQVPNGLFNIPDDKSKEKKKTAIQKTAPLTLEERYKGMNVMTGEVNDAYAGRQLDLVMPHMLYNKQKADELDALYEKLKQKIEDNSNTSLGVTALANQKAQGKNVDPMSMQEAMDSYQEKLSKIKAKSTDPIKANNIGMKKVLQRHAVLKYINTKYVGRVITVDMSFNPYLMSGFPAVVLANSLGTGFKTLKTMIGMVQQVKHLISRDGEASTSAIINSVRFIDEPTDMDEDGNPLFLPATDPFKAKINPETLEYEAKNAYFVSDGEPIMTVRKDDGKYFDLKITEKDSSKKYAKDLLAISKADVDRGKINGIYLDSTYEPNKIAAFYKAVFGHKTSFMVGSAVDPNNKPYLFMYDSIHEAIDNLMTNPKTKDLLNNYEEAMKYIKRDICCEEGFFCGILGLTVEEPGATINDDIKYVKKETSSDFDATVHRSEYFGISSDDFDALPSDLKDDVDGSFHYPGDMSSIREGAPLTAFIQERQQKVRDYKDSVLKQVEGVSF